MLEKFHDALSTFKERLQDVRAIYYAKRKEHYRICDAIRAIEEAPPARSDLERLLIHSVDLYCDRHAEKLRSIMTRFEKHAHDGEDDLAKRLADGFFNYPMDYGLAALNREGLRLGVKAFAASCEWPEDALSAEERTAKLAELQPIAQKFAEETAALSEQLEQSGVKLN